ncbi:hypothetical protein QYF36_025729 [Acer negundo]|nr:hypothetical protein QYF36_025729 [Acer negundo]
MSAPINIINRNNSFPFLTSAVLNDFDVISLSLGGVGVPYYLDAIDIKAFGASDHGVFVSASTGNGGPGGLTVTNIAPWVTIVGVETIDRDFQDDVHLGNVNVVMNTLLLSTSLCLEWSLDLKTVIGKIVLCDRGINSRAVKCEVVKKASGVEMILANGVFDGEGLVADCHIFPAIAVGASVGDEIRKYIITAEKSKSSAIATIVFKSTHVNIRLAPVVALFFTRGLNPESSKILKPDMFAPRFNILAAWHDKVGPSGIPSDKRRTEFNILSRTSMACPHVSGLRALLKAAHPEWSPAMIRSVFFYNNRNETTLDESIGNTSTTLDFDAGHIHP